MRLGESGALMFSGRTRSLLAVALTGVRHGNQVTGAGRTAACREFKSESAPRLQAGISFAGVRSHRLLVC